MELLEQARWPRAKLDELINEKLRTTLSLAFEYVPAWYKKFKSLGITPDDIKTPNDLLKLYKKGLELTKEEIIAGLDSLRPTYSIGTGNEEFLSSGSRGLFKAIWYSQSEMERVGEQGCFIFDAMGLKPGDRILSLMAPPPFTSGMMLRASAKKYRLDYHEATLVPTPLLPHIIKNYKPIALASLPTRLYNLPRELGEMGIDVKSFGIKSLGMGGEPSTTERRRKIAEEWGVVEENATYAHDTWATCEAKILSFNCASQSGMHVIEPYSFITVIDPETKEEVSPGEEGVDLVTSLFNPDDMPGFIPINYTHGDVIRLLSLDICSCGRTFKRITHPYRNDEIISARGVKLNIREIESYLARNPSLFTGEYTATYGFDERLRQHVLEYRLERQELSKENMPPIPSILSAAELEIFKSNPPALSVMKPEDIKITITPKGELYRGLNVQPGRGKPIRLIRLNP
jgi:phenylacetate-CoA ligase